MVECRNQKTISPSGGRMCYMWNDNNIEGVMGKINLLTLLQICRQLTCVTGTPLELENSQLVFNETE